MGLSILVEIGNHCCPNENEESARKRIDTGEGLKCDKRKQCYKEWVCNLDNRRRGCTNVLDSSENKIVCHSGECDRDQNQH